MAIVLRDIFEDITNKVSANLIAGLKVKDSSIEAVNFMAGHPLEISNRLLERSKNDVFKFKKYPLIALFQDIIESKGKEPGIDSESTFNLIIARSTSSKFIADQRYESNFKPFLNPIYDEFLNQIYLSGKFQVKSKDLISHTKIDRLFWGSEKANANVFNDYIDCIEIRDLKLKVRQINC